MFWAGGKSACEIVRKQITYKFETYFVSRTDLGGRQVDARKKNLKYFQNLLLLQQHLSIAKQNLIYFHHGMRKTTFALFETYPFFALILGGLNGLS